MILYHLWLLIQKSLRYAWRLRTCRCCPKIIFELLIPILCFLILILIRWIHTPSPTHHVPLSSNGTKATRIQIAQASIIPSLESNHVMNFFPNEQCPPEGVTIEIVERKLFNRLQRSCPRSRFSLLSQSNGHTGKLILNTTSTGYQYRYQCGYFDQHWCHNTSVSNNQEHSLPIKHPSVSLCADQYFDDMKNLVKTYLALESRLHPGMKSLQLTINTWPCSSYASDSLFELAPRFVLVVLLILIDGCILFSFNLLIHALIDEKHQGIIELLRLISIRPILNSFAWFLRVFFIQFIVAICLIIIFKISFDGGIYFPYVSIWLIIPTIFLWTIQVLSRAVFIGHLFNNNLKASLWSWFVYFISFWLAISSSIRLPIVLHHIAAIWLPFYSIKRLFLFLIRINIDLGRRTHFTNEIIFIWLDMIVGIILMWLLAYYLEQVRPGKYGIARPWSWPFDFIRRNRIKNSKRRESVSMQMVETHPDVNTTIRVNNLTKTYGRFHTEKQLAVDHVSFKLEKSMIHGLIGHNGAGKTSTMEMICGLLSCDCGTIEIHDRDLYDNLHELQTCIGYCPQQDMLFSHLTVQEQLEFYACVRSNGRQVDYEQIQQLLVMMDMYQFRQRLCHTLSGGMQRKLSILCAFVGQANVIILDEPSSSLDPVARRVLWSWLRQNKTNRTLLISSHLLDEVEELCDSVIILDSGKIRAQGTILELKRQFGPPGDRLHLEFIPKDIPRNWIIDEHSHLIQIPDRRQLISLLARLEQDNIKYSLENITLDDIFLKLTSTTESSSSEENTVKSQIETLFQTRTSAHKWTKQILGVLIRRGQVFLRRARLLPIVLLLYLAYALTPLYMPSFTPSSSGTTHYIISSPPELINSLPLKHLDVKYTAEFYSPEEFEKYLLGIQTWQSDYRPPKRIIGLRIPSSNQLECFVPSPALSNILSSCIPIYKLFSNQTLAPLQLSQNKEKSPFSNLASAIFKNDGIYYCFHTLPFSLHLSIVLLSLILIISAALVIQDYSSGFHSYSLIHGLYSPIHWFITFISDLILCLIWLMILILIARFVHSSTFNGRFFALTPLYFIVNLPFIYLFSKWFRAPILGATLIVIILQFAHILYTFRVLIELFRSYRTAAIIFRILRWLLVIIFPNVNVFTLIVAILRPYSCPFQFSDEIADQDPLEFADERYPHKILIHTLIFIAQFIIYFVLLFIIDMYKLPVFGRTVKGVINQREEDDDVAEERGRIEAMNNEEKQKEALVVENLFKKYSGSSIPAVNRLTFAVSHRQCFGLLGFNGSGKTTTFRMLVGELHRTGGNVYKSNAESIGYCPQDDISFSALTVLQSIDYICRLHGVNPSSLNNLILSQFQLEKYRHRLVSHLSGGTRRRLHLALCLIGSPTLLLLDEPTAKVDPVLRAQIRSILQHRPIDTSIVFASHSILECEQLCDRLTILVHGNARCLGTPRHLKEKYGTNYRIRLTPLHTSMILPELQHMENSNEYIYPKSSLAKLFQLLESLVEQNLIASNYTVQLTSLEHIFLTFQHPRDIQI